MRNKILYFILGICTMSVTSCLDMDRTPQNIWTDDDLLSNDAGIKVYMARLYSQMPWEDFRYMGEWGFGDSYSYLGCFGIEGTGEAINRDGICRQFTSENTAWWGKAFTLIREANHLIETLPDYAANFDAATLNGYIGQGYFVRAYSFYQMARRFGGVPLTLKEAEYTGDNAEALEVPRSTEEATWDQILADFDKAIELLPEVTPDADRGYANKYVALAFKAEAMLYAGSVAKYNQTVSGGLTGVGSKTGVRVMGFDPATANEASARYFAEAYKAAREVMKSDRYSLREASSDTPEAKYQNMVDMWRDLSSPENILVREYHYPDLSHGLDAYSSPYQWHNPLAGGTCPTFDFMELFDWPEYFSGDNSAYTTRYDDGSLRVTTGNSNVDGHYLQFDDPMDYFEGAEPRLRAYMILPGDQFRDQDALEVRTGVYTGTETDIEPLFSSYSYAGYNDKYDKVANLETMTNPSQVVQVELNDGTSINAAGANGPFLNYAESTVTGLHLRKYLDPDVTVDEIGEGMSDQPFILMRYADVLLAAAEAAVELSIAGEQCPVEGDDMLDVATEAIKDIQERAGANVIQNDLAGDNASRDIVRKERRKELAFEHKTKWDLRRWRVLDQNNRGGFWCDGRSVSTFCNNENYRFHGFYPFYAKSTDKWFFDVHYVNIIDKEFSYSTVDYYFAIPDDEVRKSAYIDQQPNRY